MRHVVLVIAVALISAIALPSAQAPAASKDPIVGSWAGTFDGDDTGKFTMAIARDAGGKLGGTLSVAPDEGGGYTATFKSIAVDGDAVTLAYESPDDDAQVQLDGTLDGKTLKGTWKASEPGTNSVMSSGSFTTSKQ